MPMTESGPDYPTIATMIGLTALRARMPALTGAGVTVGQVEATGAQSGNNIDFEVDPASIGHAAGDGFITYFNGAASTTTFNDGTLGVASSHAGYVATFLDSQIAYMGAPTGVAPGVTHLDSYSANAFLANLQAGVTDKVVNCSFLYGGTTNEDSAFDSAALSHNTVFVASAGNSGSPASPSTAYNVISVDSSTVVLAIGMASDAVPKPDISAPQVATSYTAPIVSGCAALLVQAGAAGIGGTATQTETDAVDFRTIKALLLNGATKPADYYTTSYAPTATRPLNAVYGSGQVDVDNAVAELAGGEQRAGASYAVTSGGSTFHTFTGQPTTAAQGWTLATLTTPFNQDRADEYAIRLAAGQSFVATLTWASNAQNQIDHLTLDLFDNATGALVKRSAASASNVQQVVATPTSAGVYDLVVDLNGTLLGSLSDKYALAFAPAALACFAAGTRIATERGEVAVEELAPGDWAITADGATRPVVFIGRRRAYPAPGRPVAPVRVRRDAFGPGEPRRDLFLSPDHAIAISDPHGLALVPVGLLVNGETVVQEPEAGTQTYFHVELDWHDVILAEGLPVESYLDTGNRHGFENAAAGARPLLRRQEPVAPLVVRGRRLQAARRKLVTT